MTARLGLAETLALIFTLAATFAIIVPLTGVLVRFRANYNPKRVALDHEGNATPHTGIIGCFHILCERSDSK